MNIIKRYKDKVVIDVDGISITFKKDKTHLGYPILITSNTGNMDIAHKLDIQDLIDFLQEAINE